MIHAQCPKTAFPLRADWPSSLPTIEWRGHRLVGSNPSYIVDLSPSPLGEVCKLCNPNIGLSVIAHLIAEFPKEAENICQSYGLHWGERLAKILTVLLQTPASFQNWVDQRKFSPQDLAPLLAVADLGSIEKLLSSASHSKWTRSEAVQALEWAIELHLMGHDDISKLIENQDFDELRRRRRPLDTAQWAERQKHLAKIQIPRRTVVQWKNEIDVPLMEVRFQAQSKLDFLRKLDELKNVQAAWID